MIVTTSPSPSAYLVSTIGIVAAATLFGTSVPIARDTEAPSVRPVYAPFHSPQVVTQQAESLTSKDLIAELRSTTSFTWDQMSKLFGVSRRTVHLWAAGGNMAAQNEEQLNRLVKEVRMIHSTGSRDERMQLFTLLDRERSQHASTDRDINRPAALYAADV